MRPAYEEGEVSHRPGDGRPAFGRARWHALQGQAGLRGTVEMKVTLFVSIHRPRLLDPGDEPLATQRSGAERESDGKRVVPRKKAPL